MTSHGTELRYRSAELTDVGKQPDLNEDIVLSFPDYGIFCVADGMGSIPDEEIASQTAAKMLAGKMSFANPGTSLEDLTRLVTRALDEASYWIKERSEERGADTMATTAAVLILDRTSPGRSVILHAGDSRCYRLRGEKLQPLTADHSIAAVAGISDEADLPPMLRGVVTNAIGTKEKAHLERTVTDVRQGDTFLLCSDGLTRMLPNDAIERLLYTHRSDSLEEVAALLVAEANDAGGEDNISVVLVRIDSCPVFKTGHTQDPLTDMTSAAAIDGTDAYRVVPSTSPGGEDKTDPSEGSGA